MAPTPRSTTVFRLAVSAALLAVSTVTSDAAPALTFEKDIRPIFKTHCFQCHGEEGKTKGGLDVRLKRLLMKGGEHGPAIVSGRPDSSLLYKNIVSGEMPKGGKKLAPAEIALIRAWIDKGAPIARAEPEDPNAALITEEERAWWAFQPLRKPAVPANGATNPIDAFLLARLKQKGLSLSLAADRRTLLRRATFDLTGLPPTPEETEAFLKDTAPDAYDKLVDRLLASPRYGERWGRHWLDVAGYADSEGYTDADSERAWAWRYRDYVIRAFNSDMPFDRFIQEQLAGDEMVQPPHTQLSPEQIDKLTATGFLCMAPDGTGQGGDEMLARNEAIAGTLQIVGTSLLGLTLDCARCHNHRYDPIPQADYYKMRAIFSPALDWKNWRVPAARQISLYTDADRAKAATIEEQAKALDADRTKKVDHFIGLTLDWQLTKQPENLRTALRTAYRLPDANRTAEQKTLLKDHPSIGNISAGSLYLYDSEYNGEATKRDNERKTKLAAHIERIRKSSIEAAPADKRASLDTARQVAADKRTAEQKQLLSAHPAVAVEESSLAQFDAAAAADLKPLADRAQQFRDMLSEKLLKEMAAKAKEVRDTKPEEQFIRALTEPAGALPLTHIFHRGDHAQPKDAVKPGELTVVSLPTNSIPEKDAAVPSSGRRLALAKRLTDGTHPLAGRALVNRIWLHHFGRGIVDTPGDFGRLGELPSHPELLDWLAADFAQNGWQLKRLHKLIMTSHAYRQTAQRTKQLDAADPENRLLGRMNVRRIESEIIRDSALALSGQINLEMFGKPVPVMEDEVGQFIIGRENLDGERKPGQVVDLKGQQHRRSVYVQVRRSRVLSIFNSFDAPTMEPTCAKRTVSTVAPQALIFMNNDFIISQSRAMAMRLQKAHPENPDRQLALAWEIALCREPGAADLARARAFLTTQTTLFTEQKDKEAGLTALSSYCHALISSNAFIYVD